MYKTLLIAWREFKYTALTKSFIIGSLLVPVLLVGALYIIPKLTDDDLGFLSRSTPLEGQMVVVSESGITEDVLSRIFQTPIFENVRARVERNLDKVESLRRQVGQDPELFALAVFESKLRTEEESTGTVSRISLYVDQNISIVHAKIIERYLRDVTIWSRVIPHGISPETSPHLLQSPVTQIQHIDASGNIQMDQSITFILFPILFPVTLMFLLWITITIVGSQLMTSTVEEKSTRVLEVLLSTVSPLQIMTGKILGLCLVSFVTMAMYSVSIVLGFWLNGITTPMDIQTAIYFALYFFMAFFTVATLMAAAGSAANDMREAQSISTPITTILVLSVIFLIPLTSNPHSTFALISSFVPLFTPFVMTFRIMSIPSAPMWQIVVSLVWGYALAVGLIWLSARIFRVGILMTGQTFSPRNILKWLRYR